MRLGGDWEGLDVFLLGEGLTRLFLGGEGAGLGLCLRDRFSGDLDRRLSCLLAGDLKFRCDFRRLGGDSGLDDLASFLTLDLTGDGDLRLVCRFGDLETLCDFLGGDSEGCIVFRGGDWDSSLCLSLLMSSLVDLRRSGLGDLRLSLCSGDFGCLLCWGEPESLLFCFDFRTGDLESPLEPLCAERSAFLGELSRLDLGSGDSRLDCFLGEGDTRLLFLGGETDSLFDCLLLSRLPLLMSSRVLSFLDSRRVSARFRSSGDLFLSPLRLSSRSDLF